MNTTIEAVGASSSLSPEEIKRKKNLACVKRYQEKNKAKIKAGWAAYRQKNKEKIDAYNALAYARNKEREKARGAARREAHPERVKATKAAWRATHKRETAIANKKWTIEHPGARKELHAKWALKNAARIRSYSHKRRAKKRSATVGSIDVIEGWEKRWRAKAVVRCYWCNASVSPTKCHTDHIEPIAKGGPHAIHNLCIACATCNNRKNAKLLIDWNTEIESPALF